MVLVILDGYGYREDQQDNAIYSAKTPVMDALWAKRPHTLIDASGLEVGLPDRQMGNSEVGHVNLGAGRIVYQDLTRLDVEIKERTFFANPVLTAAVDKAVAAGKAVHIMGLMSPGGVHSHEDHIMAMVELAAERGAEKIYLHAFLDGRDTPPRSAEKRWRHSKPNLPRWAKAASRRSSAATTPWTATTAGIALNRPMI
jgi:2,3-bisphosphoglycerate-independent phosphoglycerate mutase